MKIDCIGGGPGGLYLALLARIKDPRGRVRVFERDAEDRARGWGVVLDADLQKQLAVADPPTAATITAAATAWDTIDVLYRGKRVSSNGYRFRCIGRQQLLDVLRRRCRELGVELHFGTPVDDLTQLDADLVVAADGLHSATRERYRDAFAPRRDANRNRYLWCGTPRRFDRFAFILEDTPHGWVWVQAYRYDATHSTFIVECSEETYLRYGSTLTTPARARTLLEAIFAPALAGAPLRVSHQPVETLEWRLFQRVSCARWHFGNIALLGDAAHTAHFSVGSGTKLALEDAVELAEQIYAPGGDPLAARLERYQQMRQPRVQAVQRLADNSNRWFEDLARFTDLAPEEFSYLLLTRTRYASGGADSRKVQKMLAWAKGAAGDTRGGHLNRLLEPLRLTVSSQ